MKKVFIALLCLLLTSCVTSTVTSFHSAGFEVKNKNFFIQPVKAQHDSLEYTSYAEIVTANMIALGAKKVDNILDAHHILSFQYGVKNAKKIKDTTNTVRSYPNIWGAIIQDARTVSNSYNEYERYLELNIRDRDSQKKLLECNVTSIGDSKTFNTVSNQLFKDLFLHISKKKDGTESYINAL